jgi:hypothetical protein
VVANPLKVGQISGAKVKTDKLDVERLLTLLIADIVPESGYHLTMSEICGL